MKSSVPPCDAPPAESIAPLPAVRKRSLPYKTSPRVNEPADAHDPRMEKADEGTASDPSSTTPSGIGSPEPTAERATLQYQLNPPGRVLKGECGKLDYRRKGSKCALALKILEGTKKLRTFDDLPPEPPPRDMPKRMRPSDPVNDALPGRETAQSLFGADKNLFRRDLPLRATDVRRTWGTLDSEWIHAETALLAHAT